MSYKDRNIIFITNIIAITLMISVLIPFSSQALGNFEIAYKFIAMPIAFVILSVINAFVRYSKRNARLRILTLGYYMPFVGYLFSAAVSIIFVLTRTTAGYSYNGWLYHFCVVALLAALIPMLAFSSQRRIIKLNKRENIFADSLLLLAAVIYFVYLGSIAFHHKNVAFEINSAWVIVFSVLMALALAACLFIPNYRNYMVAEKYNNYSRKAVLTKWYESRELVYQASRLEILNSLYHFTNVVPVTENNCDDVIAVKTTVEELLAETPETVVVEEVHVDETIVNDLENSAPATVVVEKEVVEEEVVETVVQKEVIVEKIEVVKEFIDVIDEEAVANYEARKAQLNTANEELNGRLETYNNEKAVLLKRYAELTNVDDEDDEQSNKGDAQETSTPKDFPPKLFAPQFDDLVTYAKSLPNVTCQENLERRNYRFYVEKTLFLILSDTPRDYRMTFITSADGVKRFAFNPTFSKANSPADREWYRIVNRGDWAEEDLYDAINGALALLPEYVERVKAEKAKKRYEAKLAKMKPAERRAFLKKEAEKEKLAREKAEKKAQLEEIRLAKLEAKRLKEERKASKEEVTKTQAQKEPQVEEDVKEKEALRLAKEREKEEALKAKEKEETLKAIEKEKEAALKVKEKEKEKLALQKAKEKEKEAALKAKEKEKEKLALQKAKEKEKEKLALQKAKEKEKEAALKAKEKEKEKLALQKAKEKEKEAALKAKEKEKEKLALQKAKEKEKEKLALQKAKEKEKEKLALQKAKEKEKEKLALQKAKEKEKEKLALQKTKEKEAALKAKEKEKAKTTTQKAEEKEAA